MPSLLRAAGPIRDAYTDEATPTTNHGTETELRVRSESGANRRTWLIFDTGDILPNGWWLDQVHKATLRATPSTTANGRSLEARFTWDLFDEETITWDNQPTLANTLPQDTHADAGHTPHEWDVTEALKSFEGEGGELVTFLILDATEDASPGVEQSYASREDQDGPAFELELEFDITGLFNVAQDTYVDEATPDTNYEGATRVYIRSESGGNRRTYLDVNLSPLPPETDSIDRVQVSASPVDGASTRTLEARAPDADAGLDTLTWNNQPALGDALATEDSGEVTHRWNSDEHPLLLDEIQGRWQAGDATAQLALLDSNEDAVLTLTQEYRSQEETEGGSRFRTRFWISDFVRTKDLSSQIEVVYTEDLASQVQPSNVPGTASLPSLIDVVFTDHLAATVTPTLHPIKAQARIQGVITRLFLEPLDDFRRITDEAGTVVTRVQDGASRELRRIVQLVDSAQGVAVPHGAGTVIDRLRRGDAVLFGLGGDEWEPGTTVAWDGADFVVAGVVGRERMEGELLYQEIGLRRLSVVATGRAKGAIA